ncbi:hypothetical protein FKR81_16650 [Lentzea tibetensis]|uniref:Uncharacterized protein n=1 Tax=Lentzea tibetensis TaxID=2591470 RepID=A0A563EUH5_9PSEU|nr:hypothetical protein [Lentzea tibetensis]TWP51242.1 hypothetical protein FKR81_16650 [Lentzea tibetensis]
MCRAGGRRCNGSSSQRTSTTHRKRVSRARKALNAAQASGDTAAIDAAQARLNQLTSPTGQEKPLQHNDQPQVEPQSPLHISRFSTPEGDVTNIVHGQNHGVQAGTIDGGVTISNGRVSIGNAGHHRDVTALERERDSALAAARTALENGDGVAYGAALDRLGALPRETPPVRRSTGTGDVTVNRFDGDMTGPVVQVGRPGARHVTNQFTGTTSGMVVQAGQINGRISMSDHRSGTEDAHVTGTGNVVSSGDIVNGRPVPARDMTPPPAPTGRSGRDVAHDGPHHVQVVTGNGNTVSGHPNRPGSTTQVVRGNGNTVSGGRSIGPWSDED